MGQWKGVRKNKIKDKIRNSKTFETDVGMCSNRTRNCEG
jgi:hypothetical protein